MKHVYNYELPNVPDNYVHRIGRTARAGKDGAAIAFCAPDEMKELKDIQKTMKMTIPVASGRMWEPSEEEKPKQRGGGGGRGRPGGGRPGGGGGRPAGGGGKPGGGGGQQRRRRSNGGAGGGAAAS